MVRIQIDNENCQMNAITVVWYTKKKYIKNNLWLINETYDKHFSHKKRTIKLRLHCEMFYIILLIVKKIAFFLFIRKYMDRHSDRIYSKTCMYELQSLSLMIVQINFHTIKNGNNTK